MEMPNLIVLFARVVDAGSFSEASRALGQSPSAVSKQIARLEDSVGVCLLVRSKSGVTLTEEGQAFYEHCAEIRRGIDAAEELIVSFSYHPKGLLHVAATVEVTLPPLNCSAGRARGMVSVNNRRDSISRNAKVTKTRSSQQCQRREG